MHLLLTFPFSIGISGGGTYAFLQTACHLKASGNDVTIMPLNSSGLKTFVRSRVKDENDGRHQITALQNSGIQVIPVPANRLSFLFDPLYMRKAITYYLSRQTVDAIISWHHEAALLGNLCRKNNIFFACRAAGNYEELANNRRGYLWSKLTSTLVKAAFTRANLIWATSDFTRSEIIDLLNIAPSRVKVIPEGLNPIFFQAKPKPRGSEPIKRFLYYGAWSPSKGLFDALDALGQVAAKGFRNWEFRVAGWGNKKVVLHSIRENGIIDQVKLLGRLDHPGLVKVMEWAQVAILPSYIESFGLAVAETLASGTPVIAYDTSAVSEIIENGRTGWLVPLKRTDLLAQAVVNAINNPAKTHQMGISGREKIAKRFSWPHTIQLMMNDLLRR